VGDENVLERMVASVKRLALLPEAEIRELFESISEHEMAAYSEMIDHAVERADRALGAKPPEEQREE
jgi:hypothetical protein